MIDPGTEVVGDRGVGRFSPTAAQCFMFGGRGTFSCSGQVLLD